MRVGLTASDKIMFQARSGDASIDCPVLAPLATDL
jgi:hypothetical protein